MELKRCKQCSRVLPIENFRLLRGARKSKRGHQSICKDCEALNNKLRYVLNKIDEGNTDDKYKDQLEVIKGIYDSFYKANAHCLIPNKARVLLGLEEKNARKSVADLAATFAQPVVLAPTEFAKPTQHSDEPLIERIKCLTTETSVDVIEHLLQDMLCTDYSTMSDEDRMALSGCETYVDILAREHPDDEASTVLQEIAEELYGLS